MAVVTRWSPFERVQSFDRFNKMMEEFFGSREESRATFVPAVDVSETDEAITFHAELPGVNQENLAVEVMGDRLTIKGRREFHHEDRDESFLAIERSFGMFQRTFRLDVPVKTDHIEATFKDGVLTVVVPKAAKAASKKVPIKKA